MREMTSKDYFDRIYVHITHDMAVSLMSAYYSSEHLFCQGFDVPNGNVCPKQGKDVLLMVFFITTGTIKINTKNVQIKIREYLLGHMCFMLSLSLSRSLA